MVLGKSPLALSLGTFFPNVGWAGRLTKACCDQTQLGAPTGITLADEWRRYINQVLVSLVNRSLDTFWTMYSMVG